MSSTISNKNIKHDPYNASFTIKITKGQDEILKKNKWIAEEIRSLVREHISIYE